MPASSLSPRLTKGAFITLPDLRSTPKILVFQYNPDSIQRTVVPQLPLGGMKKSGPYRVEGQPVETISLDIKFDAVNQLEHPDQNPTTVQFGIYPQLAALESIMRPTTTMGKDSPYTLFAWGAVRSLPVLLTNYLVTEEAFDPSLNPIRAKANVMMRVLTASDFAASHPGRKVYLDYLKRMGGLAAFGYSK